MSARAGRVTGRRPFGRSLRATASLQWTRLLVALHAWPCYVTIRLRLRRQPLPDVIAHLGRPGLHRLPTLPPARLGQLVYRVLSVGPSRPRCLFTSLVHYRLLCVQGHHPVFVIGLSPARFGKDAHSWVELDAIDVGPPPGRRDHLELARYG